MNWQSTTLCNTVEFTLLIDSRRDRGLAFHVVDRGFTPRIRGPGWSGADRSRVPISPGRSRRQCFARICLIMSVLAFSIQTTASTKAFSDDSHAEATVPGKSKYVAWLVDRLNTYRIHRDNDNRLAELKRSPLMRWFNPISGARGGVFLWTIDNVPVVIMKCHVNDRKKHCVESGVMVANGSRMTRNQQTLWNPARSALVEFEVDDLPPSESTVRRLIQMRRIAASINVKDDWGESEEPYKLRPLTSPIYRYSSPTGGVVDGAIFAYAQGSNPEAIVIIESVQRNDKLLWRCGFARLTGYRLTAHREGMVIYDVPKVNHPGRTDSYWHKWEQPRPYPFSPED